MLIKEPDGPLTSGQLIDALKAGKLLKRSYYNDCDAFLRYTRQHSFECYGWASALGEAKDRLFDILSEPDKWSIATEEEAFPNRK